MLKRGTLEKVIRDILAGGHPKTVGELLSVLEKHIPAEMALKYRENRAEISAKHQGIDRKRRRLNYSIAQRIILGRRDMVLRNLSRMAHKGQIGRTGKGLNQLVWAMKESVSEQAVVDERVRVWLEQNGGSIEEG